MARTPLSRKSKTIDISSTSLTLKQVKKEWISYIMDKPWGTSLRMSVRLRRELQREPNLQEVQGACAAFKVGGPLDDVSGEDIMGAFNNGEEVNYSLKCLYIQNSVLTTVSSALVHSNNGTKLRSL